jgi:hypothetical protein
LGYINLFNQGVNWHFFLLQTSPWIWKLHADKNLPNYSQILGVSKKIKKPIKPRKPEKKTEKTEQKKNRLNRLKF